MAHQHSIYDTDLHFKIDPATREIKNESEKVVIMQYDHNSERFTFEIPKEVDGHDMSLCNYVQIHYINTDEETKVRYEGLYEVDDLQISPDGSDTVICSWLLSRNVTQYAGLLSFVLIFKCIADDGTEDYAWSTAPHDGVSVRSGIYNSDVIVAEYADILEQWRQELILANIVESYTPEEVRTMIGAVHILTTATISTDWSGTAAPYTQEVAIADIYENDAPHITATLAEDAATAIAQKEAWALVGMAVAGDGKITFYCYEEKPTVSIPIQIEVNR